MDDERLHQIIEDDLCEQCDEPAMPYDSYWDIPYCATHAMEYLADVALEDYTEASAELADQAMLVHLTFRAVVDSAECCSCPDRGMSRLAPPEFCFATFNACTRHAGMVWMPHELETRETWEYELDAEFNDK